MSDQQPATPTIDSECDKCGHAFTIEDLATGNWQTILMRHEGIGWEQFRHRECPNKPVLTGTP